MLIINMVVVEWPYISTVLMIQVYLNAILGRVEVFVNLCQTTIHVPQQNHTQWGSSTQHTWRQSRKSNLVWTKMMMIIMKDNLRIDMYNEIVYMLKYQDLIAKSNYCI